MTQLYRIAVCIGMAIALLLLQPTAAWAAVNPAELAKAVKKLSS
jgi:hypothetical protein